MSTAISGLGLPTGTASSDTPTGSNKLGKNEFLKLLIAQLGAQDPTAPVDNQQMVAQLAQFSSLEQAESTNQKLDQLILSQASSSQLSVAGLVGKTITVKTDTLRMPATGTVKLQGHLDGPAAALNVIIKDENGNQVAKRTLNQATAAGNFSIEWDGLDDNGQRLPAGTYSMEITAADAAGKAVGCQTQLSDVATGVSFENGYPELLIAGQRVTLSQVVEISQTAATTASPSTTNALNALYDILISQGATP